MTTDFLMGKNRVQRIAELGENRRHDRQLIRGTVLGQKTRNGRDECDQFTGIHKDHLHILEYADKRKREREEKHAGRAQRSGRRRPPWKNGGSEKKYGGKVFYLRNL